MGSRKNWPRELADRCNAVGWNARLVPNGHWKADLPDGTTMSWAESPSDTNGYKMAMRKARQKGLDALEQKLKLQREKERLERIQRDRELNGVPESDFAPNRPTNEGETQPMDSANSNLGYIEVEGTRLAIAETAPAYMQHWRGGDPRELDDARELLLIDHSVRYQCRKLTLSDPGLPDKTCDRHFPTPGGVVVHQTRVHQTRPKPKPDPDRDLGGVFPADTTPVQVTSEPDPAKVEQPGVMARMEDLGNQVLDVHYEAQRLANHAQDVHAALVKLAQDLPAELASDEMRQKAEILDQMRGLLK
jgi:hypothetical protein